MLVIAGSSCVGLAALIARGKRALLSIVDLHRFADGELQVDVNVAVQGQDVVIVQSTASPVHDNLFELLLLADTVRRAGCARITAVVPYFGYSRQDRCVGERTSMAARLVADLLASTGIKRVVTVDLHVRQVEGFFSHAISNLSANELFASNLDDTRGLLIVAPDFGAVARARSLAAMLSIEMIVLDKVRGDIVGNIRSLCGKHCVIVDDIVDTGATLLLAHDFLYANGAAAVSACITHAVLSAGARERIEKMQFSHFYVTDTIQHERLPGNMEILSVSEILASVM